MNHGMRQKKLNRTSTHRRAMLANMAVSLIQHEQIVTTLPKAVALRPVLEKMVTAARSDSLAMRRRLLSKLPDAESVQKLLTILADRYRTRPGGYLRIVKAGRRFGDNAPIAVIEFVDRDVTAKGTAFSEQLKRATSR